MKKGFKRTFKINSKNEMIITETTTYTLPMAEGLDKIVGSDYDRPKKVTNNDYKEMTIDYKNKIVKNVCTHDESPLQITSFKNSVNGIVTCPKCGKEFKLNTFTDEYVTFSGINTLTIENIIDNLFLYKVAYSNINLKQLVNIQYKITHNKQLINQEYEDILKIYNSTQDYLLKTPYPIHIISTYNGAKGDDLNGAF